MGSRLLCRLRPVTAYDPAMRTRLRTVCAAAVLLVGAAACTSSGPDPEIDPDTLVGMTLDTAHTQAMEAYDGSATIDLSSVAEGGAASDGASKALDDWIVAAACTQSNDPDDYDVVELGILPPDVWVNIDQSPEMLQEFRDALSCAS